MGSGWLEVLHVKGAVWCDQLRDDVCEGDRLNASEGVRSGGCEK